jgi:hypothetical protein
MVSALRVRRNSSTAILLPSISSVNFLCRLSPSAEPQMRQPAPDGVTSLYVLRPASRKLCAHTSIEQVSMSRQSSRSIARVAAQGSDCIEQLHPVPECCDVKLFQVLFRQARRWHSSALFDTERLRCVAEWHRLAQLTVMQARATYAVASSNNHRPRSKPSIRSMPAITARNHFKDQATNAHATFLSGHVARLSANARNL